MKKDYKKEKILLRYINYKLIIFSTIKNRFNKERDKLQKLDFEKGNLGVPIITVYITI